ncbi:SitI3 family protein [Actinoplanes sp. CA-015351]|uniref:SitI3 family protein n=1 Tax=Actinoplanes sp. CA-015351 TaxID=3239897 RepID=UPI003D9743EE
MAIEYDLRSDADLDAGELLAFFAEAIGSAVVRDGAAFREGMYVTPDRVPEEDDDPTVGWFGFKHRSTTTFRFSNQADVATTEHNTAVMVGAVLAFFHRYDVHGVLLFNGEVVVIQRLTDRVSVADDWAEWLDGGEVAALIAGQSVHPLAQPLL